MSPSISLSTLHSPAASHHDPSKALPHLSSIMGFITSMARCMRENRLSYRLSNAKPQRLDDDANDLIETTSHPTSPAPAESIASSSTMVQHTSQEPVVPTESPAHRKQFAPMDWNIHTLFDEVDTLDPATSRAIRALSMPEYPVLKLDTVQSPFDTPTKTLADAIDPEEKSPTQKRGGGKSDMFKKPRKSGRGRNRKHMNTEEPGSGTGSKIRRSMTGLLKGRLMKVPRTPTSLKTLRNPNSPKWIDASSVAEEDFLDETDEEKWLEVNALRRFQKRKSGFWTGEGMRRLW
ncbi:uncharacterized protein N7482_003038 [Penicillium canariense]|uniref:Uncharacterized protein n=1 Tax=Penicillium canariense TaxID=189055 RepID=A0A9W9IMT1_9EURO|nr:uncharacterized protein N7482_003038 [Penicillium canariense]KAJ5177161.1 hypothetical protein N7482_003038 [Penicillium canariense]